MDTNFFHGLYPALITPFLADEHLDEDGLARLADHLIRQGADGLYVCGSSGEAMLLSLAERKRVLEVTLATAQGRVPVVAHIGCQRTADTIELAQHAGNAGARAISALPPVFYRYTIGELSAYYREVMDAVPLPFIVYNAPALTGVFFDRDNIGDVFDHPCACGMKFTSYDTYRMQRLMAQYPEKTVINGHDEIYLSTLALGTPCAIGSTLNFQLEAFRLIREQFKAGDLAAAQQGQDRVNQVIDILMEVGVFRGLKGVLSLLGLPGGHCRRPFAPMTDAELRKLEAVLPLLPGRNGNE